MVWSVERMIKVGSDPQEHERLTIIQDVLRPQHSYAVYGINDDGQDKAVALELKPKETLLVRGRTKWIECYGRK